MHNSFPILHDLTVTLGLIPFKLNIIVQYYHTLFMWWLAKYCTHSIINRKLLLCSYNIYLAKFNGLVFLHTFD